MKRELGAIILCLSCVASAQDGDGDFVVAPPPEEIRAALKLSPFYKKAIIAGGFAIVSSEKVSDYALKETAWIIDHVLAGHDDIRKALAESKTRLAVMAYNEFTTDIPEHSDLTPKKHWDHRARGLGATPARPAVSCAEENVLGYPGDPYSTESILIHEFAHAIHEMGLRKIDPTFDTRLKAAFDRANKTGLWKNTYAATNPSEYFAEGVQSWFHCNRVNDNEHNDIDSREKLKKYDTALAALLEEVFKDNAFTYTRAPERTNLPHLKGYDASKAPRFIWPDENKK